MLPRPVTASTLFAPFGRLLRKLHDEPQPNKPLILSASRQPTVSGASPQSPLRRAGKPAAAKTGTHRQRQPLRVVRVMEAGQASALAGRILMSGRMADVCAELDRMVERETAVQSSTSIFNL